MRRPTWQLEWNDGMSVGIPEIDDEHKQFISQLNELNRAITEGRKQTEIKDRLKFIVDDTARHFAHEEKLFRERGYPEADGHALTHKEALQALQKIQEAFIPHGLDSEWVEAGLLIKSILMTHILTEDMKYASYFKSGNEEANK